MNRQAIKQRFNIIGDSAKLNTAIDIAIQAAPTEVTVLVVGENGVGKDIFSQIIFQLSKRKHKSFIAINCGAIPEGTIDSELFGHEKGSFTSAYEARKGYFEEVNGGMIFLDEIAEMPLATQSRLLRVLENGEYLRVGSSKVQKTDVRVIAATNKNLLEALRNGKFREDLYFRLNTITIYVPPLRERGADIELLFRYFAQEFATRYGRDAVLLDEAARKLLYEYHWPGNIRELKNFVEKLTVLSAANVVTGSVMEEYLPINETQLPVLLPKNGQTNEPRNGSGTEDVLFKILFDLRSEMSDLKRIMMALLSNTTDRHTEPNLAYSEAPYPSIITQPFTNGQVINREPIVRETPLLEESLSLERKEKDLISKALQKFSFNRKKAATELGISERTLYRKIKSYGLE